MRTREYSCYILFSFSLFPFFFFFMNFESCCDSLISNMESLLRVYNEKQLKFHVSFRANDKSCRVFPLHSLLILPKTINKDRCTHHRSSRRVEYSRKVESFANHLRIIFVRILKFLKIYRYERMTKNSKKMGLLWFSFVFRKIWR